MSRRMAWHTDISAVDETEKIQERDGWNDHKINLPFQSSFGRFVKLNK